VYVSEAEDAREASVEEVIEELSDRLESEKGE